MGRFVPFLPCSSSCDAFNLESCRIRASSLRYLTSLCASLLTGNYTTWTTPVGSCANWNDPTNWSPETIQGFQNFALASMDALQNYFFWTWKIGKSTNLDYDVNPMWHYRLGLEKGWAPKDPRSADGHCASLGVNNAFSGTLNAWNTGGVSTSSLFRRKGW